LAKKLVKVPFVSIANLVAGRCVVPELLQEFSEPKSLSEAVIPLLSESQERRKMADDLRIVAQSLGGPGASSRVLDIILSEIASNPDHRSL
jgi:lipid-A-disaccharide synthase